MENIIWSNDTDRVERPVGAHHDGLRETAPPGPGIRAVYGMPAPENTIRKR